MDKEDLKKAIAGSDVVINLIGACFYPGLSVVRLAVTLLRYYVMPVRRPEIIRRSEDKKILTFLDTVSH
jgi:hypothetical protein